MEVLNKKKYNTDVIEKSITDEEKVYCSNKLQEAEAFDNIHKETYSLDDMINKHKGKYGI